MISYKRSVTSLLNLHHGRTSVEGVSGSDDVPSGLQGVVVTGRTLARFPEDGKDGTDGDLQDSFIFNVERDLVKKARTSSQNVVTFFGRCQNLKDLLYSDSTFYVMALKQLLLATNALGS